MKPIPLLLTICSLLLLTGCNQPTTEKIDAPAPSTSVPNTPSTPQSNTQTEPTPETEKPTETKPNQPAEPEAPVQNTDPSLSALQAKLAEKGSVCGIAFLGYLPDANPNNLHTLLETSGYLASFPFLGSIPTNQIVTYEGDEVYCVVPQHQALSVRTWICNEQNAYQGTPGDTLYFNETGAPVIVIGNLSDVIPNLLVTLTEGGNEILSYTPSLSMCDGTVALPVSPAMYDFSIYPSSNAQG